MWDKKSIQNCFKLSKNNLLVFSTLAQLKNTLNLHRIKFAQKKCYSWALNLVLFFDNLVLLLLTKFVQNCTITRCSSGINSLNFYVKLSSNWMQICPWEHQKEVTNLHHCRKLMQIRCHKGAGTKMHKCLVGRYLASMHFS